MNEYNSQTTPFFIRNAYYSELFRCLTLLASITLALHTSESLDFTCFSFFMVNKIAHNSENTNIMNLKVTRILNKT